MCALCALIPQMSSPIPWVDKRDGTHSKPGTVTLLPMTAEEAISGMKHLKSPLGSGG
jgi:hypothetical protein